MQEGQYKPRLENRYVEVFSDHTISSNVLDFSQSRYNEQVKSLVSIHPRRYDVPFSDLSTHEIHGLREVTSTPSGEKQARGWV